MRAIRVYQAQALTPGATIALDEGASRHLLKVLRLAQGECVRLFNGDGREFEGRIAGMAGKRCQVELHALLHTEAAAVLKPHLGLAISKGERMDFAIQKAVELGVERITPLFSERSVVKLQGERLARRHQHWQGVAISACEQSGRARLVEVCEPRDLGDWLQGEHDLLLTLAPDAARTLPELPPPRHGQLALLVGPEGGLSQAEIDLARRHGAVAVRLGPRVLRTETAPLAALAAIQALWGDYRL